MAGIGFELRKIYNEDSLFSKQKAYAYAGIVYTGPMLLGILLTAGVVVLTMVGGISENERDYILSNLTYAIIFSLVFTSLFSLVVTRFVADMLYEKKFETIIPSFYASSALMLMIGTPLYALYLALASRSLAEVAMGVLLFGELCLVWNVITYLTAIKSYKEIIKGFFLAIGVTIVYGLLSIFLHQKYGIFLSICLGYGGMMFWMAFQMLLGNDDTQSRNMYLYSPQNSTRWYIIPWDNDSILMKNERRLVSKDSDQANSWEVGVSNYWGNQLFQRLLKSKEFRKGLDEKMDELRKTITGDKITSMSNEYAAVI